jgi:hypothetical protein
MRRPDGAVEFSKLDFARLEVFKPPPEEKK